MAYFTHLGDDCLINIDKNILLRILNDNFKEETIQYLRYCIDKELKKSIDKINCDFIAQCVDDILEIENIS